MRSPVTLVCYAVNGIAAAAYVGLIVWGLIAAPDAGFVLAFFAPLAVIPYLLAAGAATAFASRRAASRALLVVSLISSAFAIFVDFLAAEEMISFYQAAAAVKRLGKQMGDSPAGVIAVLWLMAIPVGQIILIGIVTLVLQVTGWFLNPAPTQTTSPDSEHGSGPYSGVT